MDYSMFGAMLPQQAQEEDMRSRMVSPNTFAQLNPLQQIVALGGNAGAMVGGAVGNMMGGRTSKEAEGAMIKEVFDKASQMSEDPAEQYAFASREFRRLGMNDRALALEDRAGGLAEKRDARTAAAAKESAAAQRVKATGALVQRKLPDLSPEEAAVLGSDETFVRELFKNPKKVYKTEKVNGQLNVYDEDYNLVKTLGTAGKSLEESLGAGLAQIANVVAGKQAEAAGSKGGQVAGESIARIQSGYNSLTALKNAKDMLDKGIFAGAYGPLGEQLSRFTMGTVGSSDRVVNTQEFRSYIGQTVMPMMQMLGGSDSNEELKKMEAIMAANTTLEPKAMKNIIDKALSAVERDIKRIQMQQEAVQTGGALPTGPIDDTQKPKPTKRWNSQTGRIETIGGN
jgi:uncharacterized protein YcfJ